MHSLEWIVVLLPWCSSVYLYGMGVHCDHTAHIRVDLSLWFDSPMFWAPWHQIMSIYSQPSFSSSTWKRGGVWMCNLSVISQEWLKIEVKLLLSANRKSYMLHRLAQQWMTLSDLERSFHASCAISVVAELLAWIMTSLYCQLSGCINCWNLLMAVVNENGFDQLIKCLCFQVACICACVPRVCEHNVL